MITYNNDGIREYNNTVNYGVKIVSSTKIISVTNTVAENIRFTFATGVDFAFEVTWYEFNIFNNATQWTWWGDYGLWVRSDGTVFSRFGPTVRAQTGTNNGVGTFVISGSSVYWESRCGAGVSQNISSVYLAVHCSRWDKVTISYPGVTTTSTTTRAATTTTTTTAPIIPPTTTTTTTRPATTTTTTTAPIIPPTTTTTTTAPIIVTTTTTTTAPIIITTTTTTTAFIPPATTTTTTTACYGFNLTPVFDTTCTASGPDVTAYKNTAGAIIVGDTLRNTCGGTTLATGFYSDGSWRYVVNVGVVSNKIACPVPTTTTTTSTSTSTSTSTTTSTTSTTTTKVYFAFPITAGYGSSASACADTFTNLTIYGSSPSFLSNATFYSDYTLLSPYAGSNLYYKNTSNNEYVQISSIGSQTAGGSC